MFKRLLFQFYSKDFFVDRKVAVMNNFQLGGYFKLLCYMWMEDDCTLPNDNDELAALSGLSGADLEKVLRCFVALRSPSDRLAHKRLIEEREKQDGHREKMSDAGRKGNEKRWGKPLNEGSLGDRSAIARDRSSSSSPKSFNKLKDKSPQKKEKVLKEFPEEVLELSKEFFLAVRSWLPEFQKKVETDAQITNLLTSDTWALEISRAISIDMRTSEQIRFLLHYVHGGEVAGRNFPVHNFWSKNILSPKKLREKFDQLTADARSKLGGRKNSVAQL
jgi:uncharacterized protein YdaU (DUF1376 family)